MAPPKNLRSTTASKATLLPLARKAISTRQHHATTEDQNVNPIMTRGKRKAESSPIKNDKIKRSALGNLTNNVSNLHLDEEKRNILAKTDNNVSKKAHGNVLKPKNEISSDQPLQYKGNEIVKRTTKIITRAAAKNANALKQENKNAQNQQTQPQTQQQQQQTFKLSTLVESSKENMVSSAEEKVAPTTKKSKDSVQFTKPATRRISNEFEKSEDSLYMSALEDITSSDSIRFSGAFDVKRRSLTRNTDVQKSSDEESNENRIVTPSPLKFIPPVVPDDVVDFDKETIDDPYQVPHYAMDIFNYLKQRENNFAIEDYMHRQIYLSKWMRSLLIDWMVEVQETFELNHETLYLAVKVVDIYLGKQIVLKDKLQLLGAAALFIACKFDERTPPLVEDFLYVCDGAYHHKELIRMEMSVLKVIDFDLSIPLSYRFLRRYARCAKIPMPMLTLARYILEFSLMDYATISFSDSKMACAALFIALKMDNSQNTWNKTLEYYSGYKLEDFAYIAATLNTGLHRKPKDTIKTIRSKYSHKIFFEVAKIPLVTMEKLFENTGILENVTTGDN